MKTNLHGKEACEFAYNSEHKAYEFGFLVLLPTKEYQQIAKKASSKEWTERSFSQCQLTSLLNTPVFNKGLQNGMGVVARREDIHGQ